MLALDRHSGNTTYLDLDVPVDDAIGVKVGDGLDELREDAVDDRLVEAAVLLEEAEEVAGDVLEEHVDEGLVLGHVVEGNDARVDAHLLQNFDLAVDFLPLLGAELRLVDDLHRYSSAGGAVEAQLDLTERSTAQQVSGADEVVAKAEDVVVLGPVAAASVLAGRGEVERGAG